LIKVRKSISDGELLGNVREVGVHSPFKIEEIVAGKIDKEERQREDERVKEKRWIAIKMEDFI
jgi:hypothetical protein